MNRHKKYSSQGFQTYAMGLHAKARSGLVKDPLQQPSLTLKGLGSRRLSHGPGLPWAIQKHLAEPPHLETQKSDGQ